jgi:hypothetical protein
VSYPVENAVLQWEEGYRALQGARGEPSAYRAMGRAVVAVQDGLRKRLGSSFSTDELASLYREEADWALDLAMRSIPAGGRLSDSSTIVDAAFYLYMREASDFGGGSLRVRGAG